MRKLIVALVVLALVLVGADIAGRLIAQQKASEALGTQLDAVHDPSVSIHGFSFLVQAVRGDYSHITIDAGDVALGPIHGATMHADLYGVRFPLSDALSGNLHHLSAGRAAMRAVIPGSALASALQQPGLTLSPAGDGMVQVHTTIAVAGQTFPVTVDLAVTVTGNELDLAARPVSADGFTIPAALAGALQQRLTRSISLAALPFPLSSATVSASDGNLVLTASATDVSSGQLSAAG